MRNDLYRIRTEGFRAACIGRAALFVLLLFFMLLRASSAQAEETSLSVPVPVSGTGVFRLLQEGTELQSITIAGSGSFALTFSESGTYSYTIASTDAWNTAEYLITAVVRPGRENAGGLSANLIIQNTATSEKSETAYYPLVAEDPPVAKRVAGEGAPAAASFTVTFTAVSTTSGLTALPMPGGGEDQTLPVTLHGGEEKELGTLVFDRAGEYVYELKETAGNETGFTYDTAVYRVVYRVTKDDTGFHCTKTYYKDGAEVELLRFEFVNRYAAQGGTSTPGTGADQGANDGSDTGNKGAGRDSKKDSSKNAGAARETERSGGRSGNNAPGTGDETDLLLWTVLMLLSAAAAAGALRRKKPL